MENFDYDLQSLQEARNLARLGKIAANSLTTQRSRLTEFCRIWFA